MPLLNTRNTIISYDVKFIINTLFVIIKFTLILHSKRCKSLTIIKSFFFLLIDIIETLQFTHVYIIKLLKNNRKS